jgi:hypothetical protein
MTDAAIAAMVGRTESDMGRSDVSGVVGARESVRKQAGGDPEAVLSDLVLG